MDKTRDRKFCLDFIRMYKARPALWNVKSTAYKDRNYKKLAYHELTERLRRLYPDADIDMAKRKINSIRACWRRELTKIRASHKAIALNGGKGDEYQPSWWLFPHLTFLKSSGVPAFEEEKEEEEPLPKKEQDAGNETSSEDEESEGQQLQQEQKEQSTEVVKDNWDSLVLYSDEDETFDIAQGGAPCQRNEFLDVTSSNQKTTSEQHERDCDADIYGRCWALQYKELKADQKIYAKKAIEDIFFEAKLGTLQRNSVKINGN